MTTRPSTEYQLWLAFILEHGWEHFDAELDNPGGAATISEQAQSVIDRLAMRDYLQGGFDEHA